MRWLTKILFSGDIYNSCKIKMHTIYFLRVRSICMSAKSCTIALISALNNVHVGYKNNGIWNYNDLRDFSILD